MGGVLSGDVAWVSRSGSQESPATCSAGAPCDGSTPEPSRAADDTVGQHEHEQDQEDAEDRRRRARRPLMPGKTWSAGVRSSAGRTRRANPPRSGPTTVAVPPITTRDEELDRELEGLDLVGARAGDDEHRARPRDARVQRAEREREHLDERARLMPTVAAAASWSRTAISARPNRLRTITTRSASSRRPRTRARRSRPTGRRADRRGARRHPRRRGELRSASARQVRAARARCTKCLVRSGNSTASPSVTSAR